MWGLRCGGYDAGVTMRGLRCGGYDVGIKLRVVDRELRVWVWSENVGVYRVIRSGVRRQMSGGKSG